MDTRNKSNLEIRKSGFSFLEFVSSKSAICALCLLCAIVFSGCAIQPRGPVVSHTIEYYAGRKDGLVRREVWKDDAFTRGIFFFADPSLTAVKVWHTNQTALGGCSHFEAGAASIVVSSNLVPAIAAGGTAVGNIVGAAAKSALK